MDAVESPYQAAFFEPHTRRSAYRRLARFLLRLFRPRSAVDFGCGLGETLHHLRRAGCEVHGLDGSAAARQLAFVDVQTADLAQPVDLGRKYDLAISTEVAEHLPESAADQFVANVAAHAGRAIFFTAAQADQPGVGHLNCRPKEYWAEKFAVHGFIRSPWLEFCASVALYPLVWDAWWIRRNALVLVRDKLPRLRAALLLPGAAASAAAWRVGASRLANFFSARRRGLSSQVGGVKSWNGD
jgi:SAM-dependent methyltransferase